MKRISILVFILILITGCNKNGKIQATDEKKGGTNVHIPTEIQKQEDLDFYGFFENESNLYLDKTSEKYKQLLNILSKDLYAGYLGSPPDSLRNCYSTALDFYNKKRYEKAIDNFILACEISDGKLGMVYYQLGLCLMDFGDYDAAKMAFQCAIKTCDTFGMDDLYSIDNNGLRREKYFSYYNIACIESLQNNLTDSYEYLCEALYHGYPYIDHIKSDADLTNLFAYNKGSYLRSIQEIFNKGSINTVAGKAYAVAWGGAPIEYHFIDRSRIYALIGGVWPDPSVHINAEYEIRNYIIVVKPSIRLYSPTLYIKSFEDEDGEYRQISNY
jgi:tetratricopeptide (TPR) repeat protein